jgi:hypothetical protein
MTLGTGVFLSSILVSLVFLYSSTKDRWNWRKGVKRIGIGLTVLTCLGVATYFSWDPLQSIADRPKPFRELGGITLGASQADVKFLKGLPDVSCTDSVEKDWSLWAYKLTSEADTVPSWLVVTFMETHGAWTIYIRSDDASFRNAPELEHVNKYESLESIDKRFGPSSSVIPSEDGLSRTYAYRRYNLRVDFAKGQVTRYGIYYHPNKPDVVPLAPGSKRACIDKQGKDAN